MVGLVSSLIFAGPEELFVAFAGRYYKDVVYTFGSCPERGKCSQCQATSSSCPVLGDDACKMVTKLLQILHLSVYVLASIASFSR